MPASTPSKNRPTINDVARLSGVSKATVSKALDGSERYGLSDAVRKRVNEAAEQLGYRGGHRGRVAEETRSIGLFYARSSPNPGDTVDRLIAGAASKLQDRKCRLVHVPLLGDSQLWKSQIDDRQLAGGLVIEPVERAIEIGIRQSLGRFVFLNVSSNLNVSQVLSDSGEAASVMTRHLLQLGHRRIVFCASPGRSRSLALREDGYELAMRAGGCEADISIARDAMQLVAGWKKTKDRTTAVIADTLNTAMELLHGFWERGISVPKEISIASLEDAHPAQLLTPALTAMRIPAEELGIEAVNLLMDQIEGEQSILPRKVLMTESLVIRQSTAEPSQ